MDIEKYMKEAMLLAKEAAKMGEVPVGCVIADSNGNIIGRGRNRREELKNDLSHAEIAAINEACINTGNWRLDGCSLFVTLEPCQMCAGAIIKALIKKHYYGAREPVTGSCGSIINLFMENYGHEPQITGGILEEESRELLASFFESIRKRFLY